MSSFKYNYPFYNVQQIKQLPKSGLPEVRPRSAHLGAQAPGARPGVEVHCPGTCLCHLQDAHACAEGCTTQEDETRAPRRRRRRFS